MEIKVCKALKADIASPYVWVSESLIHADDHRRYFRITRPAQDGQGKTSIVCQVYRAGADYKRRFKESRKHVQVDNGRFIVMSEHYRNQTGWSLWNLSESSMIYGAHGLRANIIPIRLNGWLYSWEFGVL